MSRTTLSILTAVVLAILSVGIMIGRTYVLGNQVRVPSGPGTWKVTLVVQGQSTGDAKLTTAMPLDFGRQHVLHEVCRSAELLPKPQAARHPERHLVLWSQRPGVGEGPFRVRYEFDCKVDVHHPSASMSKLA